MEDDGSDSRQFARVLICLLLVCLCACTRTFALSGGQLRRVIKCRSLLVARDRPEDVVLCVHIGEDGWSVWGQCVFS